LNRVEEEDEYHTEKQEQQLEEEENKERRTRRAELGPPEPMGLGITQLSDDED
jgi:hypothetical protein